MSYYEINCIKTAYPLGCSFLQYPCMKSPNDIFKDMKLEWEIITTNYFGSIAWKRIK